jgi:transposase
MIHLEFSQDILTQIQHHRLHHPHHKVRQKMDALWQKSLDIPHWQIGEIVGITGNTLRNYFREYQTGGLESLLEVRFYHPTSELADYKTCLKTYFTKHPPHSAGEAAAFIKRHLEIDLSPNRVLIFLKSLGIKRLKVGQIPAKADVEAQQTFVEEQLEPRIEEAKAGKRALFFVDAAHFVQRPFLAFVWCFVRVFMKTPSGRKRFNVLGALNAVTHELITVCNDRYINAESVAELFHKLAALRLNIPITLVLDNARYQKCTYIKELAASLDIELLYLPPYSPNLNLIERLWKFVKKEALTGRYYEDFPAFKSAIVRCLAQTQTTYKTTLDSLLALHFQTFSDAHILVG